MIELLPQDELIWGVKNIDSCSVYGTGRIHCHNKISVNYHRAINRAEKEPLDDANDHNDDACLLPSGPAGGGNVGCT